MMHIVLQESDLTQRALDVKWIPSLRPAAVECEGRMYAQSYRLPDPDGRWVYRTTEPSDVKTQRIRFHHGEACAVCDCLVPATWPIPDTLDLAGHTYRRWSRQPDGTIDYLTSDVLSFDERKHAADVAVEFHREQMNFGRSRQVDERG